MKIEGTPETIQVIAAAIGFKFEYDAAKSNDGKVSMIEWGLMAIHLRKPVALAIENIQEVPKELLDLEDNEVPALSAKVSEMLTGWGVKHRVADITGEGIRACVGLLASYKRFAALPPSAIAV